jgi:subtilisin family serine protease
MSTHVGGRDRNIRNRQLIQRLLLNLALLLVVGVIGPVFAEQSEPKVEIFGAKEIPLSSVYDPQTNVYFAPELDPKEKEASEESERLLKLVGWKAYPVIRFIDTGVLSHHPLIARALVASKDFTGEGPEDQNGHGTVIALTYLVRLPGARIVSVKAIGKSGKGEVSDLLKAIEWVTEEKLGYAKNPKLEQSPDTWLVNMSLGVYLPCRSIKVHGKQVVDHPRSCERTVICQAASKAFNNGVLIIAAVGNQPDKIGCPACCKDVTAVGAPAEYAGRGADLLAPGTVRLVPVQ